MRCYLIKITILHVKKERRCIDGCIHEDIRARRINFLKGWQNSGEFKTEEEHFGGGG